MANEDDDYEGRVAALYDERYAADYPALYIAPWRQKHEQNAANLRRLLAGLAPSPRPAWLDVACGQAWHFAAFPGRARMVGLDLSRAQLRRARVNVPQASFVCADMARAPLRPDRFDLVTCFWGAYCYLARAGRIDGWLRDVVRWLRPGGAFYLEVLLAEDLQSFNASRFAASTGFQVVPAVADHTTWWYDDTAGRHVMSSPPLPFFVERLAPHFETVEATHDGAFMVHLLATGRRG